MNPFYYLYPATLALVHSDLLIAKAKGYPVDEYLAFADLAISTNRLYQDTVIELRWEPIPHKPRLGWIADHGHKRFMIRRIANSRKWALYVNSIITKHTHFKDHDALKNVARRIANGETT